MRGYIGSLNPRQLFINKLVTEKMVNDEKVQTRDGERWMKSYTGRTVGEK